ncbi:MAG: hypothetical protein PVJ76_13635 [Gemmatimonadota bacterium]|jgi:hypothetical protein
MASDIFKRDDLSIYVVAGVPRSFKKKITELVEESAKRSAEVKLVSNEMTDWMLAKLREDDRRSFEKTPASAALWRAFRALGAARYHLQHQDSDVAEKVRQLRNEIEDLWTAVSPLHEDPDALLAAS